MSAELTQDFGSDVQVEQQEKPKSKVKMTMGKICVTHTTKKIGEKTATLVCQSDREMLVESPCLCVDTLNKTQKKIHGKIVNGSHVPQKVAVAGGVLSPGFGGYCYQMPKYMGSKGETAWYCSDDALNGYETEAMCRATCRGI